MGVEFVHKVMELTVAIVEIKSYVRELEKENERLKAQNETLVNLLKVKKY